MVAADRNIPTVIGLGEVLWDCFGDDRRPGGAPANVAYNATQFGCRGVIASRVGDDELGRELMTYLEERGLDTSLIQLDAAHPTGTVTVDASVANDPQYTIHEGVAWDHLECPDRWVEAFESCSAVCFGTLAQRSDTSRRTIEHCLAAAKGSGRALIVCDVNLRQNFYNRGIIERSMTAADIVKLGEAEAATLNDLLELDADDPQVFGGAVCDQFDVQAVCITRGAAGCMVMQNDGNIIDVPGMKVDVVDAVGAGDAFTASLIASLLNGWTMRRAAECANEIGGLVASRDGAMPDIRIEVSRLRARYE